MTLSKRTEEIVKAQLKTERYATPDEVVNRLIEERPAGEVMPELPASPDERDLKSSLLAAVDKPAGHIGAANSWNWPSAWCWKKWAFDGLRRQKHHFRHDHHDPGRTG